jgi:hypothetical protein
MSSITGNVNSVLRLPFVSLQISSYFLLLKRMSFHPVQYSLRHFFVGLKERKPVSSGFSDLNFTDGITGLACRIFWPTFHKIQAQP